MHRFPVNVTGHRTRGIQLKQRSILAEAIRPDSIEVVWRAEALFRITRYTSLLAVLPHSSLCCPPRACKLRFRGVKYHSTHCCVKMHLREGILLQTVLQSIQDICLQIHMDARNAFLHLKVCKTLGIQEQNHNN